MPLTPGIRIELLGGFRVLVDGRSAPLAPTVRQQELVAFLLLHDPGVPIARQKAAGSIWPDSSDAQALTNLRRELHHLREHWPALEASIESGSRTLTWRVGTAAVDVVDFHAASTRGLAGDRAGLLEAARLYRGDLFPDCRSEWIEPERERLRHHAQQVLSHLVARLESDRDFTAAIEHAQHWLRVDPLSEPAWCALMRCHARRGDRATALHVYQQCAAQLKRELGVPPSAATRLTYHEILDIDTDISIPAAPPRTAVYPLVGRQREWQALLAAWQSSGERSRLFVIRGEAGIGKTRLAEELVDWCGVRSIRTVSARCYAGEGRLAYALIAAWLKSDALQSTLMGMDAAWLTDVARIRPELLASRHDVPAPDRQLESWQRLRFFEAISQVLRSAAPLVLVADDVQWADADTIEWLHYFLRSAPDTRCLIVATVRAEEEEDNPALARLLGQLERTDALVSVSLGALDSTATVQLAAAVLERQLDEEDQARTVRETEGHPLFIIERGRMDLAAPSGAAIDHQSRVQSVVAARLALLSDEARATAEVAAAIGRDFTFDILAHASDLEEDVLVRALDELWRRHIVREQSDERWDFSHDRIREVAYGSIGPARRRLIHRRIAQGMELLFARNRDEVSASIAMHLDRGGQPSRAVPYLERAASVAARVSAHREAIRLLGHALSLLEKLPADQDRAERELALRSSLSIELNSTYGYGAVEVEENLNRVFELLRSEGRGEVPVRWLWVAFTLRFMRGDLAGTREVAELALARSADDDPSCRCEAHHAMGGLLSCLGELEASRTHFEAALAAYDEQHPQQSALGSDLGVFAHAWYAHPLWLLGDESAAVAHARQAIALARRLDHTYSLTLACAYAALLHQLRGDRAQLIEAAENAVALSERHELGYYGDWARILIGWAIGHEQPAAGIATIESALARLDAQRARARRPYYLSLLADLYTRAGNRDRAESILDASIAMALERGDLWYLPALYLQKSEHERPAQRDRTISLALETARSQGNRGLERRILSAARLQRSR